MIRAAIYFAIGYFFLRILPGWVSFAPKQLRSIIKAILSVAGIYFILIAVMRLIRMF